MNDELPAPAKRGRPRKASSKIFRDLPLLPATRVILDLELRHFEWLGLVAKSEGRTLANMVDRIIRLAYAADPTKGGRFMDSGTVKAKPASSGGGTGITGQHPATGGE